MTVEADLYTTLHALVAGRCFPDVAPFNTPRPFICFEQTGGDAFHYVEGTLPDKKNGRFEIGVYADTRAVAAALALQVETAMAAATVFVAYALHAPISDYASDVLIYSSTQNFSVTSGR